ncbi:hypothetical protein FA10DRAFT_152883 [Acaromyces ingoldii]|uniref:Uncharacterized protein n=1 Tax=Acaromyces ingoldii TaxID=215250 RepID=A0A316YG20_9BASI|nr:hypothetical protein FA10DRAFT_152883 [Acaromyces ingoldii]PWN88036.1 hypothetical protein FA10DRAFT_152883 [Acaromyces ingoldii]
MASIQALEQIHHPFGSSSGDDADSPPSLTHSSDSPQSTAEESSPQHHQDTVMGQHNVHPAVSKNDFHASSSSSSPQAISGTFSPLSSAWSDERRSSSQVKDDSMTWESAFSRMDEVRHGSEDMRQPSYSNTAATSPSSVDHEVQLSSALSNGTSLQAWASEQSQGSVSAHNYGWNNDNDEAMFDSLIQEDSFE